MAKEFKPPAKGALLPLDGDPATALSRSITVGPGIESPQMWLMDGSGFCGMCGGHWMRYCQLDSTGKIDTDSCVKVCVGAHESGECPFGLK